MSYHKLSSTQGGEALLLDDASVPGKVVHTTPGGGSSADVIYLSVVNLSTAERSLFFTVTGTGITAPTNRDGMDRVDVPSSPTGVVRINTGYLALEPGYTLNISADVPAGQAPLVLYGYAER